MGYRQERELEAKGYCWMDYSTSRETAKKLAANRRAQGRRARIVEVSWGARWGRSRTALRVFATSLPDDKEGVPSVSRLDTSLPWSR